jgi:hypothetical protein
LNDQLWSSATSAPAPKVQPARVDPPAQRDQRRGRGRLAVSQTAGRVKQDAVGWKEPDAAARGTKPVELVVRRQDAGAERTSGDDTDVGTAAFIAALNVSFQNEQPCSALPVLTGLADEAVDVGAPCPWIIDPRLPQRRAKNTPQVIGIPFELRVYRVWQKPCNIMPAPGARDVPGRRRPCRSRAKTAGESPAS